MICGERKFPLLLLAYNSPSSPFSPFLISLSFGLFFSRLVLYELVSFAFIRPFIPPSMRS